MLGPADPCCIDPLTYPVHYREEGNTMLLFIAFDTLKSKSTSAWLSD